MNIENEIKEKLIKELKKYLSRTEMFDWETFYEQINPYIDKIVRAIIAIQYSEKVKNALGNNYIKMTFNLKDGKKFVVKMYIDKIEFAFQPHLTFEEVR